MTRWLLAASLLFVVLALAYRAKAESAQDLMQQWDVANDKCRDGMGDPATWQPFCDKRTVLSSQLKNLGWCWGHPGQASYQMKWEHCQSAASPADRLEQMLKMNNAAVPTWWNAKPKPHRWRIFESADGSLYAMDIGNIEGSEWGKAFQLYFAASARVFDPTGFQTFVFQCGRDTAMTYNYYGMGVPHYVAPNTILGHAGAIACGG